MKIQLRLAWEKPGVSASRLFKSPASRSLVEEYLHRMKRFASPVLSSGSEPPSKAAGGTRIWFCDRSPGSRMLDSAVLAGCLEKVRDGGCRELIVVIGGADGFSRTMTAKWKPDLRWSFGPLTLPHELAAIVAAEQLYRAWTILEGLPYHGGHEVKSG